MSDPKIAKVINADMIEALVQFLDDQLVHGDAKRAEILLNRLNEDLKNDPHLVLSGNPVDGLSATGPFIDHDEAIHYAELHMGENGFEFWTMQLEGK